MALIFVLSAPALGGPSLRHLQARMLDIEVHRLRANPTNKDAESQLANVKDFGAKGDGISDDTAAIDRAQMSLPAAGGTLYFPSGIYAVSRNGIVIRKTNLVFKGSTAGSSTLRRYLTAGPVAQSSGAYPPIQNVTFEDLDFDWDRSNPNQNGVPFLALYGNSIRGNVRVSRCHFRESANFGIVLTGMSNVVIEESLFRAPGNAQGGGIMITGNSKDIMIRDNRFLYIQNAIIVATRNVKTNEVYAPDSITVTNNYFDLGWWLLREKFTGEGPSVSYTADGLVDTAAHFSDLKTAKDMPWHNVRVMPIKNSGSGAFSATTISDPKGLFITNKVRHGDIVRAGKCFAMVASVESETSLTVEEWLADTDREPINVPANGASYIVYGIYLGSIWNPKGNGYTTISLTSQTGWWDFDGNRVTPPKGTRYEVMVRRPNYPIHADYGVRNITVKGNTIKRGWSDQISIYAHKTTSTNAIITGNTIEDGEDMGITLHGTNNYVANNIIRHHGCGGIWTDANDSLIEKNKVYDNQWVNATPLSCGDIILSQAKRITVSSNYCERFTALDRWGILIWNQSMEPTDSNVIVNNDCRNHLKADIGIVSLGKGTVTNTKLLGNKGKVIDKVIDNLKALN